MSEEKTKVRTPPNSKESEMMVLGCMLNSINGLNLAADGLNETDFYYNEHKTLFDVMKSAYRKDQSVDLHLVCEELKRQDKLKSVGGAGYIASLVQYAGTSAYVEEYIRLIKNKSILRRMIHASQSIEKTALEDPEDVLESLDEAQQLFYQIGETANHSKGVLIDQILSGIKRENGKSFLQELQERQETYLEKGDQDEGLTGIPTHFRDLDRLINGMEKSNLMILAARPAMGKTALALNIASNVCFKEKLPVGIFSLEMSAEQLVHRLICSEAEIASEKIKRGSLNGMEYQRVVGAVNEMQQYTMIIDDQPGLKITDLRARARRMKESYNIQFLVIDYLQLISGSGTNRSTESRQIEVSEISRLLKNLARELDIPILCLSQLSRKVEERTGHRPMMSDLRESGSIEQDADQIFMLFRPEYYDETNKPGLAILDVVKNRHGGVGPVTLAWKKEFAFFANYAKMPFPGMQDPIPDGEFSAFSP